VPQKGGLLVQHNAGTVGDATPGATITTGGAESTKGSYVSLLTTTFDVYWIDIYAFTYGLAAADSQGMMDIAVGAATQEVIIPDLMMGFCGWASTTSIGPKHWHFPLYIPSGTEIWARAAGKRLSSTLTVVIYVYGGDAMPPFRVGRKVTTYGVGTVPIGTTIVPGASAAEGAWAQVAASTSEDHFAFFPSFQAGTDTTLNTLSYYVDLGVGAATEVEFAQSYVFRMSADERMDGPFPSMPAFYDVPSGSRLVMRCSNSGVNDAGNYNGCIHAIS